MMDRWDDEDAVLSRWGIEAPDTSGDEEIGAILALIEEALAQAGEEQVGAAAEACARLLVTVARAEALPQAMRDAALDATRAAHEALGEDGLSGLSRARDHLWPLHRRVKAHLAPPMPPW